MKVSKKVAEVIVELGEIKTQIYSAAKAEEFLAPIKYLFFAERLVTLRDDIAKEFGKYDALVKNNRAAQFISLKVESEKKGEKFVGGAAEIEADTFIANERIARNYFEAALNTLDKQLHILDVHLEIYKNEVKMTK